MSNYQFETVDVPAGSYIAWDARPGQVITGKVLSYDPSGGTDFNQNPCPQVGLELVEAGYSVNKAGERYDHEAGDLVTVNAGLANLKRHIAQAKPQPGDVIRIAFDRLERTARGQVKVFEVQIARGAAAAPAAAERPF